MNLTPDIFVHVNENVMLFMLISRSMHTLGPKYFYNILAFVGWFYGACIANKIQLVDFFFPSTYDKKKKTSKMISHNSTQ